MDRHANRQLAHRGPVLVDQRHLGGDGALHRRTGGVEHDEKPVAGVLEHHPAGGLDRGRHEMIVAFEGSPHR
jgi:hypothetical protein